VSEPNKSTVMKAGGLALVGVAVFLASAFALLAVRGMLNREGLSRLHGLPVVGTLFPEPLPQAEAQPAKPGASAPGPSLSQGGMKPLSAGEIARLIAEAEKLRDEYKRRKETLQDLERRLESLSLDLDRKRKDVEEAKQAVEKGWTALREAQKEIEKDRVVFVEAEKKNLKKMGKVYESMQPDRAALAMKSMDEATVVKLLFVMSERSAGKALSAMEPETAAALSEKMRRLREQGSSSQ